MKSFGGLKVARTPKLPASQTGPLILLRYEPIKSLVRLEGLEPSTFRLGGGRSILLSYKCIVFQGSIRSLNITIIPGWRRDVNLK